jgi:hypothetical protein
MQLLEQLVGVKKNTVVVEHTHTALGHLLNGFVGPQRTNGTETTSVTASSW